jgi:hypothetical protein
LALNFSVGHRAKAPLRFRIQVWDANSTEVFFDDEFLMPAGSYQPAIIPLRSRSRFAMCWTAWCEGPSEPANEIHCIAPMLIT